MSLQWSHRSHLCRGSYGSCSRFCALAKFLQVELAWSLHIVVCTWFVVLPDVLGQTIDRQESTCLLAWRLVSSVVHHRILVVDVVVVVDHVVLNHVLVLVALNQDCVEVIELVGLPTRAGHSDPAPPKTLPL